MGDGSSSTAFSWRRAYPDNIGIALRSERCLRPIPASPPQSSLRCDKQWATGLRSDKQCATREIPGD